MKHKTYKLDPAIEKQLFATPSELDARVQELLDNPSQIAPFMDFRVDWSFKYILGHEEAMIKLLNDILPVHVDTIEYLLNEIPVRSEKEKRAVFDVICTNKTTKEKFLCEMQRLPESDMDDRLLFYGCSLIQKQIKRKDRKYILNTVYVICVADYERAHPAPVPADDFLFKYRLRDERWPEDVLTSKLQFYYLELPRFQKGWEAAQTNAERWCYLFRNLYKFAGVPHDASDFAPIFEKYISTPWLQTTKNWSSVNTTSKKASRKAWSKAVQKDESKDVQKGKQTPYRLWRGNCAKWEWMNKASAKRRAWLKHRLINY